MKCFWTSVIIAQLFISSLAGIKGYPTVVSQYQMKMSIWLLKCSGLIGCHRAWRIILLKVADLGGDDAIITEGIL